MGDIFITLPVVWNSESDINYEAMGIIPPEETSETKYVRFYTVDYIYPYDGFMGKDYAVLVSSGHKFIIEMTFDELSEIVSTIKYIKGA